MGIVYIRTCSIVSELMPMGIIGQHSNVKFGQEIVRDKTVFPKSFNGLGLRKHLHNIYDIVSSQSCLYRISYIVSYRVSYYIVYLLHVIRYRKYRYLIVFLPLTCLVKLYATHLPPHFGLQGITSCHGVQLLEEELGDV